MVRSIPKPACKAAGAIGLRSQHRHFATGVLVISTKAGETFCLVGERAPPPWRRSVRGGNWLRGVRSRVSNIPSCDSNQFQRIFGEEIWNSESDSVEIKMGEIKT